MHNITCTDRAAIASGLRPVTTQQVTIIIDWPLHVRSEWREENMVEGKSVNDYEVELFSLSHE